MDDGWCDGGLSLNVLTDLDAAPEVMASRADITTAFDGNYNVGLLETLMIHSVTFSNVSHLLLSDAEAGYDGVDII